MMNKTFFHRLYIDGHTIVGQELNDPFDALADAHTLWRGQPTDTSKPPRHLASRRSQPRGSLHRPRPAHDSERSNSTASLAMTLLGQCSNKAGLVDLTCQHTNRPC